MIYLPILTAFALAGGTILEKVLFKKRKLSVSLYQTASFLGIALVMLPFLYFFWRIDSSAFTIRNLIILISVIGFSVISNLFYLSSIKGENISNTEPARILEPLFVILLAILFSFIINSGLYERNIKVIIPAFIAAFTLIFSHVKKHHLCFNKYLIFAVLGSFFFALELVISQLILRFYSPFTFYFVRCLGIFFISLAILKPDFKKINFKIGREIAIISAIWVIYRVTLYYGYQNLGIISTTLVIMLSPIFIYFLAVKFLKEKITWRNILASIIILGCVIYSVIT